MKRPRINTNYRILVKSNLLYACNSWTGRSHN